MFDVLIIGGGVSGVSCAQILGSAYKKSYAQDKKIGIVMHQRASMLQDAIFYNAYGVLPGTLGADLLTRGSEVLQELYPHLIQISNEKVNRVVALELGFEVHTNKGIYTTLQIVVAVNSSHTFNIEGLMQYVEPHKKSVPTKNRIQLKNQDHLVCPGIYVAGTLAGHRSQLSIAAGSGAAVATDLLTLWNEGIESHSHDSIRK